MSNKTHMVMVRLTEQQAQALTKLAEISQSKVTAVVREMIDFGLKNTHRPKISRLEKTQLQAVYESLFTLRELAARIDSSITAATGQEAKALIERHFETL